MILCYKENVLLFAVNCNRPLFAARLSVGVLPTLVHKLEYMERKEPLCLIVVSNYLLLTLRRRIKSHLLFAGIIRSSPFSPR